MNSPKNIHESSFRPGFYPFWFWNGRMEEDEIHWQIREMADKGFKGFYIHPRQGLEQPYLSEAFFQCVNAALEEAQQCDLSVEIYDEYPYPSGPAGGLTTLGRPDHMATQLVSVIRDLPAGPCRLELPAGAVLSCVAFPRDEEAVDWDQGTDLQSAAGVWLSEESFHRFGLTGYNNKRYFASEPLPVLEAHFDQPVHLCVALQVLVTGNKFWGYYPDVMRPEVIQAFLDLTHERYRAHCGQHFGTAIHTVFTDETAPRWSPILPPLFEERFGYSLIEALPALVDVAHPDHVKVTADYRALQLDQFIISFEEPVRDWCREHGLLYTGEKPSWRLSQLKYMDLPGCEPGHTKAGNAATDTLSPRAIRSNARATASAAYAYGKAGSLCECYHSMGWNATMQDAKLVADVLMLTGITHLVPHGVFYSTHALRKHDAPPSFFFQMPYWPFFGRLSSHVDAVLDAFQDTYIDASVLLFDPHSGLPDTDDQAVYKAILDTLVAAHAEFLIVDTDMLEGATIDGGTIHLRDVRAQSLIVPPMRHPDPDLTAWAGQYQAQGGEVLRPENRAQAQEMLTALPPMLDVACKEGDGGDVLMTRRKGTDGSCWFLLNWSSQARTLQLNHPGLREVVLADALPAQTDTEGAGVSLRLAPFQSVLLTDAPAAQPAARPRPRLTLPLPSTLSLDVENKNLLRMEPWTMTLGSQSARVEAVPLGNQLADGGFSFTPQCDMRFGNTPAWDLPVLEVRYEYSFDNRYDGPVSLVIEPASLIGEWSLTVNGSPALGPEDFAPTDSHVRGSIAADITGVLQPGRNTIAITLTTDRADGGLRNPLYLAGDFAARLDGPALQPLPETGAFGAWEDNGLPWFAGALVYRGTVEIATVPDGDCVEVELDLPYDFQDTCEVSLNGGSWQPMGWSPYRVAVPASTLHHGSNEVALRVHTPLGRAFDGLRFDVDSHTPQPVNDAGIV